VTNGGSISGGHGGSGSAGAGGVGGAGVNLLTGTLTNTGSIAGGAGGSGTTSGGDGGAGVFLNGGTLASAGSISAGAGGSGTANGAAGDAVKFGTAASTLIVDPGAVFNGQVVALNSHDVLELAGTQSGGTPITLGTQFTSISTLDFAAGADWTADAVKGDLTSHPLSIDGFASGDKLDITNLATSGSTVSFNTTSHVLTLTNGATTINLQFDSAFSGKHFVLTADGHGGSDVHLLAGAVPTLAASGHDLMNFVSDEHRAMVGDRFVPSAHDVGSGLTLHSDPALVVLSGHGFSTTALTDHGLAHAHVMLR
jgi:hypothetical protein